MPVHVSERGQGSYQIYNCDPDEKLFNTLFVRNYGGPYGLQWPTRPWSTRHKPISDPLLAAHRAQKYWVAKAASFYPDFFYLDFDARRPARERRDVRRGGPVAVDDESIAGRVAAAVEKLSLNAGQFYVMTSPSFASDGSCHLVLRLEHRGEPVKHEYGHAVLTQLVGNLCEIYPQAKRKFRLPLGRDQFLITEDGCVQRSLGWRAAMHFINKLDPVCLESLPYRASVKALPLSSGGDEEEPDDAPGDNPRRWTTRETCAQLWRHGLQLSGTRNDRTWDLVVDCWRDNRLPGEAAADVKAWIHKRHNGLSETVDKGGWREIYSEIDRQVKWVYGHFRTLPEAVHNERNGLTVGDLKWIAGVFPGHISDQRRLARLLNYYRPRARRHSEVFIPYHIWHEVAGKRSYHAFIDRLRALSLLEGDMHYRHDPDWPEMSFCRRFRLHLPAPFGEPVQWDGWNITDYDEALLAAFTSISEIVALTGVRRQRFYEYMERERQGRGARR